MGETFSERLLYLSLFILTFVSGLIDAASVLAMGHVFTANMTGNVVFLAFSFANVSGFSITRSGVALGAGFVGGILAGNLHNRFPWSSRTAWLFVAGFLESLLVGAAAVTAWKKSTSLQSDMTLCAIIILTGIAMGLRNGTVRKLGVPDITTTVLTMTVASLAFDSRLAGGSDIRWHIRIASIVCMFAGAFVGALLLRHSLALVLSVSAALTLGTAAMHVFRDETTHEAKLNQR